jgi:hypothetical protein
MSTTDDIGTFYVQAETERAVIVAGMAEDRARRWRSSVWLSASWRCSRCGCSEALARPEPHCANVPGRAGQCC